MLSIKRHFVFNVGYTFWSQGYGGRVTGSVSGKTSFVLAGVDAGQSKFEKAEAVNCKVRCRANSTYTIVKTRHIYDSQDQILALSFRQKSLSV